METRFQILEKAVGNILKAKKNHLQDTEGRKRTATKKSTLWMF